MEPSVKRKNYLMVEDSPTDVMLLKLIIESETNYDVNIYSPQEALVSNRKHKPEVVQFDGLGGECFKLIPQFKSDNPDAEFLIYSADSDVLEMARRQGIPTFEKGYEEKLSEHLKKIQETRSKKA
jgi:DNA-binding NarL/FixJ family response regulator